MAVAFYIAAAIAIVTTILAITRRHPVHALLFLILSLLSVAFIFYLLGAPFLAALEVITYAGAIMVLFIFVVMLLNPGPRLVQQERAHSSAGAWLFACSVAAILLAELVWAMLRSALPAAAHGGGETGPVTVGIALYGPYLLGVEIASLLLLSALVGAQHIGVRHLRRERDDVLATRATSPDSGGDSVFHGIDRSSRAP